jgi:protein TonB
MEKTGKPPNFLLWGFILISLVVHLLVFLHGAGIYESRAISYIELSMHPLDKPDVRKIPRPRRREQAPKVAAIKTVQVKKVHIPNIQVTAMEDPTLQKDFRIDLPQLPGSMDVAGFSVPGLTIANGVANVQVHEAPVEFINAKDYFEMLHLRIYSFKRYPESARSNHIEGRVKVQFVLSADGTLTDIKILKSSRHKRLDEAAIEAIKRSSPFPRPPSFIFKTPVTLKVDILFELA